MGEKPESWKVIDEVRNLVMTKYPHVRIGLLELWDADGSVSKWKSVKTRRQWVKEQDDAEVES